MGKFNQKVVQIERPDDFKINVIVGMSHFIKTVEDIYESLINVNSDIKFGLAFCEASGDKLIRTCGTSDDMIKLAVDNAKKIGAGHSFVLFLDGSFPINIMDSLKKTRELVTLYCATANPLQVIVAETNQGRGITGVIDGGSPKGVEKEDDIENRRKLLRDLGYKK
jgi:uncharacterized protein